MNYETVTESIFTLDSKGEFEVTPEVYKSYWDYGYILIRGLLNAEETKLVEEGWTDDPFALKNVYLQSDDKGALMKLVVWDDASMDASGLFSRSQKLAGTVEKLVGSEIYHYHSKYLCKPPKTGGSFVWHQDYGYWYYNGTLFPDDMCTVFLAVDDITEDNGCLKIIPTSHKCGRIDHNTKYDDQIQADLERVEQYKDRLGVQQVVMNKGDVLIFHSNILHRSDKNDSDRRRLALATAFNTKRNNPTRVHHHPFYKYMQKVENSALLEWGKHKTWDSTKVFYDPNVSKGHMDVIDPNVSKGHMDVIDPNVSKGHMDVIDPNVSKGHMDVIDPNVSKGHMDVIDPNVSKGHMDVIDPNVSKGHMDAIGIAKSN